MKKTIIFLAMITMLITGCGAITDGALHSARENLEDKDYDDAMIDLTEAYFSGIDKEARPEVAFLRANALYGLGRGEEAKAILQFIIVKYPKSNYPPQARSLLKKWKRDESNENSAKEN